MFRDIFYYHDSYNLSHVSSHESIRESKSRISSHELITMLFGNRKNFLKWIVLIVKVGMSKDKMRLEQMFNEHNRVFSCDNCRMLNNFRM